jgi:hypothetical protein
MVPDRAGVAGMSTWIAATLALLGVLLYGSLRIAYEAFYSQLRVEPEDVGLDYQRVLSQSVGGVLLLATVAGVAGGLLTRLVAKRRARLFVEALDRRSALAQHRQQGPGAAVRLRASASRSWVVYLKQQWPFLLGLITAVIAILTAEVIESTGLLSVGIVVFVVLIAANVAESSPLDRRTKEMFAAYRAIRASGEGDVQVNARFFAYLDSRADDAFDDDDQDPRPSPLGGLPPASRLGLAGGIAVAGVLATMLLNAGVDASNVNAGQRSSFRVLGLPLTAWSATVAHLTWKPDAALSGKRPACALLLGQADGVVVLVVGRDQGGPRTLKVPADDVAVMLTGAKRCPKR